MPMKVFISYCQCDWERVRLIVECIKQRGFVTWFASDEMHGGEHLSEISAQIADVNYFLVFLSKASVNSKWVKYETSTALALSLEEKPMQVVPVFIDAVERPTEVAGLVSVDMRGRNYENGLQELFSILEGKTLVRKSTIDRFLEYVNGLIVLEDEVHQSIEHLVFCFERTDEEPKRSGNDAFSMEQNDFLKRTKSMIIQRLNEAKVSQRKKAQITDVLDKGGSVPIIATGKREEIKAWLRCADEELLAFAAELWRLRSYCGVTLRAVCNYLEQKHCTRNRDNLEWRAGRLVVRARETGLLSASTEYLPKGTHAAHDAEMNPSYDLGPMVYVVGKWAYAFESGELRRRDDAQ